MSALLEIFEDPVWQMSLGERAAVEGVLAQLKPALAIEIGTAEGAALRRIAAHAREVHSFDLAPPSVEQPANVVLHTGDSHELLPAFLAELAEQGRSVEFVIVDGDHTPEGVRRDIEDLLDSPTLRRTVILIHDTANERVRAGLDAVHFAAWPKVTSVDLDWVPGRMFDEPGVRNELWYGLGAVLIDDSELPHASGPVYEQRYHPSAPLLADARALAVAWEREEVAGSRLEPLEQLRRRAQHLSHELFLSRDRERDLELQLGRALEALHAAEVRRERADRTLEDVLDSASWKITKPLRAAKGRAGARRQGDR